MKVQDRKNPDFFFCDEIHTVREATQESTANSNFQPWKLQWTLRDSLENQVEFIKELCA